MCTFSASVADEVLAARAQGGCRDCFARLYERYRMTLARYLHESFVCDFDTALHRGGGLEARVPAPGFLWGRASLQGLAARDHAEPRPEPRPASASRPGTGGARPRFRA